MWHCNVLNCGNGKCVHKITAEQCPICEMPLIRVTITGFKFCSNPDYLYGCDYETDVDVSNKAANANYAPQKNDTSHMQMAQIIR